MAHRAVLWAGFSFLQTIQKQLLSLCLINAVVVCWKKRKNKDFFSKKSSEGHFNTINVNRQTFKSKLIFVFYRKSLLGSKIGSPIKLFLSCLFDSDQLRSQSFIFRFNRHPIVWNRFRNLAYNVSALCAVEIFF